MPQENSQLPPKMAPVTIRELQEMRLDQALEYLGPELRPALPSHIPLDRFKRVVLTAVNQTPDLARADRRSLFNACVRCAHDGLYPDGREAMLAVFRTKVKRKVEENGELVEREFYADLVQYLPMIAGIRKRMRNTGEVLSAEAHVVHRHDKFYLSLGDDPKIIHEPPPLDQDRGDPIGAYAIIKLTNGEHIREVMGYPDIERARAFSRSKDGPAWRNWWGEMARKTVLRRCAKAAPTGSELERLLAQDDDIPEASEHTPLLEIPPRPQPENYTNDGGQPKHANDFQGIEIVDVDGFVCEADDPEDAVDLLLAEIAAAAKLGEDRVKGLWESNQAAIEEIETINRSRAAPIYSAFRHAIESFDRPPQQPDAGSVPAAVATQPVPPNAGRRPRGRPPRTPRAAPSEASEPRQEPQQPAERRAQQEETTTNTPVVDPPSAPKSPTAETSPANLVVPTVQRGAEQTDWRRTAENMIAAIKSCTKLDQVQALPFGAFRRDNRLTLDTMRTAAHQSWVEVEMALGRRFRQLQIEQG